MLYVPYFQRTTNINLSLFSFFVKNKTAELFSCQSLQNAAYALNVFLEKHATKAFVVWRF